MPLHRTLFASLRSQSHWRCEEPVLVIESDDWGLARNPDVEALARFGKPNDWADERLETPADLSLLYRLLAGFRDAAGRPACMTANFVVANPDFEAIAAEGYARYYETPIGTSPLIPAWREGLASRVFVPQYHGRSHFWIEAWLRDLQGDVAGARELCRKGVHQGLSLLLGQAWRYHSEYLDWHREARWRPEELNSWIAGGLDRFEGAFGFRPTSSIAPHYILPTVAERALSECGIRYLQGTNTRIVRSGAGQRVNFRHSLGEVSPHGLRYLARTVKFEAQPRSLQEPIAATAECIRRAWRDGLPCVVDCHRLNFCCPARDDALGNLHQLLTLLSREGPQFLISSELGEAIAGNGDFSDFFTRDARHLTPLAPAWRATLRRALGVVHRRQILAMEA